MGLFHFLFGVSPTHLKAPEWRARHHSSKSNPDSPDGLTLPDTRLFRSSFTSWRTNPVQWLFTARCRHVEIAVKNDHWFNWSKLLGRKLTTEHTGHYAKNMSEKFGHIELVYPCAFVHMFDMSASFQLKWSKAATGNPAMHDCWFSAPCDVDTLAEEHEWTCFQSGTTGGKGRFGTDRIVDWPLRQVAQIGSHDLETLRNTPLIEPNQRF